MKKTAEQQQEEQQGVEAYTSSIVLKEVDFYFTKEIGEPSLYSDMNQTLRSLTQNDIVHMYFNSPGGRLDATLGILSAMKDCPARIVGHLDGDAASAITLLFLSCDECEFNSLSSMMIHAPSGGSFGHVSHMSNQTKYLNKHSDIIMKEVYAGFLDKSEIEDLISVGNDMYIFADEIKERLEKRQRFFEEKYGEDAKKEQATEIKTEEEGDEYE